MQQHRYTIVLLIALHAYTAIVSPLTSPAAPDHWRIVEDYFGSLSLGTQQFHHMHNHSTSPSHACYVNFTCNAASHVVRTSMHDFSGVHGASCLTGFLPNINATWDDLDLQLLISGQPPHPGPAGSSTVSLLIWNINSLSKFFPVLTSYDFDVCFAQEISTPWRMLSALYSRIRERNFKALLTGTDPETMKTGGVGAMSKGRISVTKFKPKTNRMKELVKGGRVQLIGLSLPGNIMLVVANLYLGTNGHTDPAAAYRADDLLHVVTQEFAHMPPGPRLLCGDFNCDVEDLPTLGNMLATGDFVDLGSRANLFGQPIDKPTCFPHGGSPSRRDYVIASSDLLPFISNFEVHDRDRIPVHAPITLKLTLPDICPKTTIASQPRLGLSASLFACLSACSFVRMSPRAAVPPGPARWFPHARSSVPHVRAVCVLCAC